jgi:hypothetical protein
VDPAVWVLAMVKDMLHNHALASRINKQSIAARILPIKKDSLPDAKI